jgi:hypothetical protein
MRILTTCFAVLAAAGSAAAVDRKVPSDDYPTIQDAADAAQPGDRILVAKGIYQETVTLNVSGVQILGKKAIWDGAEGAVEGNCLDATGDDVTVQGFTFWNGSDQVRITGNGARVQKCVFRGASSNGVEISGDEATVSSCTMTGFSGEGIYVTGNDAVVEKCRFVNGDSGAVYVGGDDALVQKNTANLIEDDEAYEVSGARARVLRNRAYDSEGCVEIAGNDCVVEGNLGYYQGDDAIYVAGDGFTIRGNRILHVSDDSDGFYVSGSGGLIEGNSAIDVIEDGFELAVSNTEVRGNTAQRCGSEGDEGFDIVGSGNTIEGNRALDVDDDAFYVDGDGNDLIRNLAQNANGDGFDINGNANELVDCTAKNCINEGLDNAGTATEVRGGSYSGNRIDVAGNSNFAVFENVKYTSGGETQVSELD